MRLCRVFHAAVYLAAAAVLALAFNNPVLAAATDSRPDASPHETPDHSAPIAVESDTNPSVDPEPSGEEEPAEETEEPDRKPWIDMDYGPYLTASIEVSPGNIAYKGLAIRLDPGEGGVSKGHEFALFDTDTLRYAAGWTGPDFIQWSSIVFNGTHQTHPSIRGRMVTSNPVGAGWAHPSRGDFEEERLRGRDGLPYGPLQRDWGHWRGLYLHGDHVVLSYRLGNVDVLESPGAEGEADDRVLTRTINLGPRAEAMILQVAYQPGFKPEPRDIADPKSALRRLAVFVPDPDASAPSPGNEEEDAKAQDGAIEDASDRSDADGTTIVAMVGGPRGASWITTAEGYLRLKIPSGAKPAKFKLLFARVNPSDALAPFIETAGHASPAMDLAPLTHGGPARWGEKLTTRASALGDDEGPYVVETITTPLDNPYQSWMRLGGFDFFADGRRAAVCTWMGDAWIVDGLGGELGEITWQRIATGMFQPLGLKIVDDRIYVGCRDQITLLHDINGDGEADFYENFNNDHQVTEHFHEFAMDLQTDADGNFYYAKGGRHAKDAVVPQHGTLLRVSSDGSTTEIVANGFRAPNGVCVNGDGSYIVSDQEGHWTPKNRINWVRPGNFYGYMMGYHAQRDRNDFEPPIVWIHNEFDRSPAEQLWVASDRWGPIQGSLISLSYGTGEILNVMYEKVDGRMQGGVVHMPIHDFPTGIMRGRFHPGDGQLYVCGLFGWAGNKTLPGGFYRIRYTGKPLGMPVELQAKKKGMLISFTDPLDPETASDPESYAVSRWNYRRTAEYGSKDYKVSNRRKRGRDRVRVTGVELSNDNKSVTLLIPDMQPSMQMEIKYDLKAADGTAISDVIENTIHAVGGDGTGPS